MNLLQLETMTRLRKAVESIPELDEHAVFDMSWDASVSVGPYKVSVNNQGVIRRETDGWNMSLTTEQAIKLLSGGSL